MTESHPNPKRPARAWRPMAVILCLGVLVRLGLLACFQDQPLKVWDERDYHTLATHLAADGEFAFDSGLTAMRPPLYPTLMAGLYKLAGAPAPQVVRLFQAMLALTTVLIVYMLGTELVHRRVGTVAAGLYCFYPTMLVQANLLLSETLFTFWLVLFCLVVTRALRAERIDLWTLAGVVLGLAALTRSIVWLFPPVLIVFLLVAWRVAWWRRLTASIGLLVAFAMVLAPWSIRSSRLEGTFVAVDTMGGRNVMMGNYEHTPWARSWDTISISGEQAWYRVLARHHADEYPHGLNELSQGRRDKMAMRYAIGYVFRHPLRTIARSTVKFFNLWQLERSVVAGLRADFFGPVPTAVTVGIAALIFGSYAGTMFLAIFGVTVLPLRPGRVHWFLLLLIAYVTALHSLAFAHSRYHLPLIPILLIFAAIGLVRFRRIKSLRRRRPFWIAVGISAVLVVGWITEIVLVDLHLVFT